MKDKLRLIVLSALLVKINSEDITFKIQIEDNKIKENETDYSKFQTKIIKSFEVKINKNQLPEVNSKGKIDVSKIKDLILKDDNFKGVDISQKNVLLNIHTGCYLLDDDFSKEKLINRGTANIYFRDKHNYHICCNRFNIKNEVKISYTDGRSKNFDKIDIKYEFEDLNEYWFESNNCCFLTKREIKGIILKHSWLGHIPVYVHENNILVKNLTLFFKEEPIKIIEIFQLDDSYKEFYNEHMTYYNIKTLYDFLYKVLLNDIKYENLYLYSIEYKDKKLGRNIFNFNDELGQMKKQEDIDKELKKIYVDKNDYFKIIIRRKKSDIYKNIRFKIKAEKEINRLKEEIKNSKLKDNIWLRNPCECCSSCCAK